MGLISFKDNNVILFHIAKCAGTSLQYFLGNSQPHELAHQPIGKKIKFDRSYVEWERADYSKIIENCPPTKDNHFVIGCVRNSYEQIVSHYNYHHKRNTLPKNYSFTKYLNLLSQKKFDNADYYHMYQKRLITIMPELFRADYIINFHNIKEDIQKLCKFLNVTYGHKYDARVFIEKYHVNKTKHIDYKRYYTKNLIGIVEKAFSDDIEHFGWQFGNFDCKNTGFTEHWTNRIAHHN